jgi:integrase/recombinase XerD
MDRLRMLRLEDDSEANGRRKIGASSHLPARIGLARLRHCLLKSGGHSVEIDFGKPFGGPRLRFWAPSCHAAKKLAREKSRELRRHGDAALLLTTAQRVEASVCFARMAEAGGSLTEAVECWIEQHPAEHRGKTIPIVAAEFVARKKASNRRERYIKDLGWKLDAFAEAFPGRELATLRASEIEGWFATRGWSPVSFRSYADTLHAFFNFAKSRRYCAGNPIDEIEMPRRDSKEPEILTVEQVRTLLGLADKSDERREMLAYVVIGTFCGIRPEEIHRMTWDEVKLPARIVVVPGKNAKGRDRRVVNISDNCAAWLETIPNQSGAILTRKLRYYRDRLKKAAGWKRWPHDVMRHSFASYHLAKHNDQALTSRQLGHRNDNILWQHYRALVMPEDASAFWSIMPPQAAA